MMRNTQFDVIVLGGGAAGLMCAITAGRRGRKVLVIDHAKKPAEKIRISGGGRCNFTNLHCGPKNLLSDNPHFCRSALSGYSQQDFIALVQKHSISFHEKTLGQLFCDNSAKDIIDMLLVELAQSGGELWLETGIESVTKQDTGYKVATVKGAFLCDSVVVATGGKSIPKMGATGFGYQIAEQFGLSIIEPRPALVPFTYPSALTEAWSAMSGLAVDIRASIGKTFFDEAMLITHRGLSGPAILQISSYWREGMAVEINLMPGENLTALMDKERAHQPKTGLTAVLSQFIPSRFAKHIVETVAGTDVRLAETPKKTIQRLHETVHKLKFMPGGTEGYRTAEVTLGGVDTKHLSQKTMEAKNVPGLYFIGEVVDVTGHLGGHNFQWAWSSGFAAGQAA